MSDPGPEHPSADRLRRFALGHATETEVREVGFHLAGCDACGRLLDALPADDGLLSTLRGVRHTPPPGPPDPAAVRALAAVAGAVTAPGPVPAVVHGYRIAAEVGRGGMGVVYRADDPVLNRPVALKMILAGAFASAADLARFRVEAESAARVRHPNVVQVYGTGEHDGRPFLVLEWVPGGTLAQALGGAPVPPAAAAELVETLARAVHAAHTLGVIHRDLKPANVLLGAGGPAGDGPLAGAVPKITDFGLARVAGAGTGLTATGALLGTPEYMAPEQAVGRPDAVGAAADVYALGVVLYETLAGRPPFRGATPLDTLRQVTDREPPPLRPAGRVPRDLETVCRKCLLKDPQARYASAWGLAEDLRRFRAGEPVSARPVRGAERVWKWACRNPLPAALMAAVAVTVAAGAATSAYFGLEAGWRADHARANEAAAGTARDEARAAAAAAAAAGRQLALQSAGLLLDRGVAVAAGGEVGPGLHWMAAALRAAPPDAPDLRAVIRANLTGWAGRHHALRHQLTMPDDVDAVAVSPDGRVIVTGCVSGDIQRWDGATGRPIGGPMRAPGQVLCLAVSPDGKTLLAGGGAHQSDRGDYDCFAQQWNLATGFPAGLPLPHALRVWGVAYRPDGAVVATAAGATDRKQGAVRFWDAATGRPRGEPVPTEHPARAVAFSPDGRRVAAAQGTLVGAGGGMVRVWDAEGEKPAGFIVPVPGAAVAVTFTPDGRAVIAGGADGLARRWDAKTGARMGEWKHPGPVTAVAVAPDGATALTGCSDGLVRLWDAVSGRPLPDPLRHEAGVTALAPLPDGRGYVTAGGNDHTARVWDAAADPPPMTGALDTTQTAAIGPDRRLVVTAGRDGTTRFWDAAAGRPAGPPVRGPHPDVAALAVSPDGTRVAVSCRSPRSVDCAVGVFDPAGRPVTPWIRQDNYVVGMAFSPDGRLWTGDYKHTLRAWDAATGAAAGGPIRQRDIVLSVAVSPDGRTVAAGTAHDWNREPQARLWDATTGMPIGPPLRHADYVVYAAFTPDGQTLVTGSRDNTFRLWSAADGEPRCPPRTLSKGWGAAAVSPDGRRLATGSQDGVVRLWGLPDGTPVPGAVLSPAAAVAARTVAFSPDGRRLAVGYADGAVQVWDLATLHPVGPPAFYPGAVVAVAFTPDGSAVTVVPESGGVRRRPIPAAGADPHFDRFEPELRARTGYRMDEAQAVTRLGPAEWAADLAAVRPPAQPDPAAWHDATAREAEAAGAAFTAGWHLDRLAAARPTDWEPLARRGDVAVSNREWDAATAAYTGAAAIAPGPALAGRLRERAAAAARPDSTRWYESRLRTLVPER